MQGHILYRNRGGYKRLGKLFKMGKICREKYNKQAQIKKGKKNKRKGKEIANGEEIT